MIQKSNSWLSLRSLLCPAPETWNLTCEKRNKNGYDRLGEHAKRHADFIEKYSDLMDEFKEQGPIEKMVNKILTVVMDWLKDHIVEADGDYAMHAKERA